MTSSAAIKQVNSTARISAWVFISLLMGTTVLYGQATVPTNTGGVPTSAPAWSPPTAPAWSPPIGPVNMATAVTGGYGRHYNTGMPGNFPNSTWQPPLPPANGNLPGPYLRPTESDSRRFIESTPGLSSLSPELKQALIVSQGNYWLNSPMLPNGVANPLYDFNSGRAVPNWNLPGTWSSPLMSWQGVSPNGFLPTSSSTYNAYSPSSGNPSYNAGYLATYNASHINYNQQVYRPPVQSPQNTQPRSTASIYSLYSAGRTPMGETVRSTVDLRAEIAGRERALAVSQAAADKVAQVADRAQLARLLIDAGRPEQALSHLEVASPMVNATGDLQTRAELLRIMGSAYLSAGDFERAVTAFQESIAMIDSEIEQIKSIELLSPIDWLIKETIDPLSRNLERPLFPYFDPASPSVRAAQHDRAEVLTSLAWAYQSIGKIPDALVNYKTAKSIFGTLGSQDDRVRTQLAIASLYQSIGEPREAIEEYKLFPPRIAREQYVQMLIGIAELLQTQNRASEALYRYQKALTQAEVIADPMQEAVISAGMGRCFLSQGNYVGAALRFAEALEKMRVAGNRAGEAAVIANLGELEYWAGISSPTRENKRHFGEALDYYNQALPLMHEVSDVNGEIGVLTSIGLVYEVLREPAQALTYYLQALQKLEQLQVTARLDEFRFDLSDQAAGLYDRAIQLEVSQHDMRAAFELSERARARVFLDKVAASDNKTGARLPADFALIERKLRLENTLLERQIGQELSKPGPEINAERLRSLGASLTQVRKEYTDAVRDLQISQPQYASLVSVFPLPLTEIQQQLPAGWTVVSYFTAPGTTLAFVITKDNFHAMKLSADMAELALAIASFRDFSSDENSPGALEQLYKWLVAPIKSQIKTSIVAIVPHGPLNGLPFAALTPDNIHLVGSEHTIFYLPSVNAISYLQHKSGRMGDQVLVMANRGQPGFSQLAYAEDEARAVASILDVKPLLGKEATAANFRLHAHNSAILHIAAHVNNDFHNPLFSGIATESDADDGELKVSELAQLDLRNTSLVVVSGCQSQLGRRNRGDDVVGLTSAFMFAGSSSVVASLWNVDDEVTEELMISFYRHVKKGSTKAESLRLAELDIRQHHPNPYYWAGFVLTGDPGSAGEFNLIASAPH
jgi:CHAT domain-containing protein